MHRRKWKSGWLLIALLSIAATTGCATRLQGLTDDQRPLIPSPPDMLMRPVPPEVLSNNAAQDIDGWTEKLKSSEAK